MLHSIRPKAVWRHVHTVGGGGCPRTRPGGNSRWIHLKCFGKTTRCTLCYHIEWGVHSWGCLCIWQVTIYLPRSAENPPELLTIVPLPPLLQGQSLQDMQNQTLSPPYTHQATARHREDRERRGRTTESPRKREGAWNVDWWRNGLEEKKFQENKMEGMEWGLEREEKVLGKWDREVERGQRCGKGNLELVWLRAYECVMKERRQGSFTGLPKG